MNKTCIFGDGGCSLQPVTGDHNYLNTSFLYIMDGNTGFRSYIIADGCQTDQYQITRDTVLLQRFFRISKCDHTHGFFCQSIDPLIDTGQIQRMELPVSSHITVSLLE